MSIPYNSCKYGRSSGAFSLFELFIVITIFSILIGLSIPSLQRMLQRYHFVILKDQLWHALYATKSMAILNQQTLELCGSRDGMTCDADWQQYWLIRNVSNSHILRHMTVPQVGAFTIQWHGNLHQRDGVYFDKWGGTAGQQGRFDVILGSHHAQIVLILSGRFRSN